MMTVERQANPARFMRRLNLFEYDAARSSGSRNVRRSWSSMRTTTFASSCTRAFAFITSAQIRGPFASDRQAAPAIARRSGSTVSMTLRLGKTPSALWNRRTCCIRSGLSYVACLDFQPITEVLFGNGFTVSTRPKVGNGPTETAFATMRFSRR
jgi:hypothetical protein